MRGAWCARHLRDSPSHATSSSATPFVAWLEPVCCCGYGDTRGSAGPAATAELRTTELTSCLAVRAHGSADAATPGY